MRNTAILPGKDKLEDMISSIEDGYYLLNTNNGQADTTSEFMFGVTMGYEIKNGRLGRAIRDTTISGVAFDVLKTTTMLSDNMIWLSGGMCGKKQPITVGIGGPDMKCTLNIGVYNMLEKNLSKHCIDSLLNAGADKCQVILSHNKKWEMNLEGEDVALLRTTIDTNLNLTSIKASKKGTIRINKTDDESLTEAVKNVLDLSEAAEEDPANDISYQQDNKEFNTGDNEPNLDNMYDKLKRFSLDVKRLYPEILLQETHLDFSHNKSEFINSNGAHFNISEGIYSFTTVFAAKDGESSSSINFTEFSTKTLDKELINFASVNRLLKQSVEQLSTRPIRGKFVGDLLITPDCLKDFLSMYIELSLSDSSLISETSMLKDKLNQHVASSKLTLHSKPVSEEISNGYFITSDGFEAQNSTLIEKGILKSFLLSLYGANKTGRARAANSGGAFVVESGDKAFEELVKSTVRGVLVCRFSGGNPSSNGDFSGVAKNSYYIENGEIKYPISETMISGNLYQLFNNIIDISSERVNFGDCLLPWISSAGITISGK